MTDTRPREHAEMMLADLRIWFKERLDKVPEKDRSMVMSYVISAMAKSLWRKR